MSGDPVTRVIAGTLGGRRLAVPPSGTRPTSDRVREALFSSLETDPGLAGLDVLDLCAGSGALGIEALSRGARHALFVESDRRAAVTLRRNLADLGLAGAAVVRTTPAGSVLGQPAGRPYQLVLADPPYDVPAAEVAGWLVAAETNGWLDRDVTVVLERRHDRRAGPFEWPPPLRALRERRYGDTVLLVGVHSSTR
jgi:16S rRNA (guanine966-N2)-methyltransferase